MVKHVCGGGGAPIHTRSGFTDWSTGNGGRRPEYHKGDYPADRITHKHPAPKGERQRYDDRTPPKFSKSGANYPVKSGKSAAPYLSKAPQVSTLKEGPKRRQMNVQDRFARGGNKHG